MAIKVDFFDGKTSKKHKATLAVNSFNWSISYPDSKNKTIVVNWNVEKIVKSTVYTKGWVVFNYGHEAPFQKIESSDEDFIGYLKNSDTKNLNDSLDAILHKSKKKSLIILISTLIILSAFVYTYVIPTVAVHFVSSLSNKNVISFGDYVFKVLSTDLEIDEKQTKKMQAFVDKMEIDTSFPLKIYVAESDVINAFALSGGRIVIFSSLLEKLESEAQLTALIGHEISHIENRHVLKNITRDLSGSLFISILIGDINGISNVLVENAHMFTQLSYSRKLEEEADIFGLEIMKKNHVNLYGMPELFSIFKEQQSFEISEYISNHPALDDRIEYTKKIADEYQDDQIDNMVLKEQWKIIKSSIE